MSLNRYIIGTLQKALSGTAFMDRIINAPQSGGSYVLRPQTIADACDICDGLAIKAAKILNGWRENILAAKLDEGTIKRLNNCMYSSVRDENIRMCGHKCCILCQANNITKLLREFKNETFPIFARLTDDPVEKNVVCTHAFLTVRAISQKDNKFTKTTAAFTKRDVRSYSYMKLNSEKAVEDLLIGVLMPDPDLLLSDYAEEVISAGKGLRTYDYSQQYKRKVV